MALPIRTRLSVPLSQSIPSGSLHKSLILHQREDKLKATITEKSREFQKNICFIDYAKASDRVEHNTLWKILKEIGIKDHLTCLLRNL